MRTEELMYLTIVLVLFCIIIIAVVISKYNIKKKVNGRTENMSTTMKLDDLMAFDVFDLSNKTGEVDYENGFNIIEDITYSYSEGI